MKRKALFAGFQIREFNRGLANHRRHHSIVASPGWIRRPYPTAEGHRARCRQMREDCSRLLLGSPRYVETRAGPVVPSFRPRNQLMMIVNSNAAPFEPV